MLDVSRALQPELEHIQGDMRELRLGRQFDAVFVHDAVVYMTSEEDLQAAIVTAFEHCKPGGAALFAPDESKESFTPRTDHGGSDREGRSLRYLEWVWDPDPDDDTYVADYAFLLRDVDGSVRSAQDRHVCGVFSRAKWLALIEGAGFRAVHRAGIPNETGPDIFLGVKPS